MAHVSDVTILICTTCRGQVAAYDLRRNIALSAPPGVRFKPVSCLAGCNHKISVGVQAAGKASYLFGPIETVEEASALGAFAHQYATSPTGWTNSLERPEALKDKTLARLPGISPL